MNHLRVVNHNNQPNVENKKIWDNKKQLWFFNNANGEYEYDDFYEDPSNSIPTSNEYDRD